jgi:hypothetical protein
MMTIPMIQTIEEKKNIIHTKLFFMNIAEIKKKIFADQKYSET